MIERDFFLGYNAFMKIKNAILGLIILVAFNASAGPDDRVRDEFITTTDRTCGLHYLTHGNTVGWYLTDVEGSCLNGLLNGAARVTLRNAFGKVVQNMNGFFAQGYPIHSNYGNITLKTLWLSDTPNQSLVFDLGNEEKFNIRYLGKMSAEQQSDDTYSAFNACEPAIVLAVTKELNLFEDESVQQELINSVLNNLAPICPDAHQVYFYGSTKENPENKDIAFFADINLESGHIKIRRLPSSPRYRDILKNPSEAADMPVPKEIRRETGLPVVQITPVKPENKSVSIEGEESELLEEPISDQSIIDSSFEVAAPPQPIPVIQSAPKPVAIPSPQPVTQPITIPKKESKQVETSTDPTPVWDDVPALLTASRLLKQPVEGKVLVHIAQFDAMGIALTDNPVALRIKGDKIPLGWVVVQGDFSHTPPQTASDPIGFVQAKSITPLKEK